MGTKEVKVGTYWRHKTRPTIYVEVMSRYHLKTAGYVVQLRDQYGALRDCYLSSFCECYESIGRLEKLVLFGEV